MDLDTFLEKYGRKGHRAADRPNPSKKGVYVVSPRCPTKFFPNESCDTKAAVQNVKIGKASGIKGFSGRLLNYKTYWPNGVVVHAILETRQLDPTWSTIDPQATKRETTLKRVLGRKGFNKLGFGADGKGTQNDTQYMKNPSEWVNMSPTSLMPILMAIGPMRVQTDRLFACNEGECVPQKLTKELKSVMQHSQALAFALQFERENTHLPSGKRGVVGRQVVVTKEMELAAQNSNHPLREYYKQLKTINERNQEVAKNKIKRNRQEKDRLERERNADDVERQLMKEAKAKTQKKAAARNLAIRQLARKHPRWLAELKDTPGYEVGLARQLIAQNKKRLEEIKRRKDIAQRRKASNATDVSSNVSDDNNKVIRAKSRASAYRKNIDYKGNTSQSSSNDDRPQYRVERILEAKEGSNRRKLYKVRWAGYTSKNDAWLPYTEVRRLKAYGDFLERERRQRRERSKSLPQTESPLTMLNNELNVPIRSVIPRDVSFISSSNSNPPIPRNASFVSSPNSNLPIPRNASFVSSGNSRSS
jgi:hypothetical protein